MGFETILNAMLIMVFDECGGKSVFDIPSKVSLIKDLSLIKDRSHIDTRAMNNNLRCI
jgi:hypothetical protein